MRVHSLEIAGFGPFGDTQEVEFDAFNEAGLFLLSGPTGAGKTSVLDAICFALYGEVPGARQLGRGGEDLVSEHREAELEPSVTLVATIGTRRIRVHRTLAHERAKKIGEGTTHQGPTATLEVWQGGEFTPRSSALSEVNSELADWVGMKRDQFSQVVMLPQGDFARFLRADSRERRTVLERLFDNYDFGGVELWLKDRTREAESGVADALRAVDDELIAAGQFAKAALGEAPDEDRPGEDQAPDETAEVGSGDEAGEQRPRASEPDAVLVWIETAGKSLTDARARAEEDRKRTAAALGKAEAELSEATLKAARVEKRRVADAELAELEARSDWQTKTSAEIEDANRAMAVRPHVEAVTEAAETEAGLRSERKLQELRLAELQLLDADLRQIREREKQHRGEAAVLGSFENKELAELAELRAAVEAGTEELDRTKARRDDASAIAENGPRRLRELEDERQAAAEAKIQHRSDSQVRDALKAKHAAAVERDEILPRLKRAEQAVTEAHSAENAAESAVLNLRERRLNGMAAELAGGLRSGEACPVCGSTEHSMPAAATEGAVTTDDEADAQAKLDESRELHTDARSNRDELDQRIKLLDQQADSRTIAELAAELKEAGEKAAESHRLAESGTETGKRIRELEAEIDASARTLEGVEAQLSQVQRTIDRDHAKVEKIEIREQELRGREASIAAQREVAEDLAEFLDQAARTLESLNTAVREHEKAGSRATAEAIGHGFGSLGAASEATRSDERLKALKDELQNHQNRLAGVKSRLAERELAEVDPKSEVDLTAVMAARAEAKKADDEILELLGKLRDAVKQFAGNTDGIPQSLKDLEPLIHRAELTRALSDLVRGKGANARRMQLSTYVLAARLEQVVAAANSHLAKMSGDRYSLAHSDQTEAGNVASGLGITVRDAHTGGERPTRTLSGGESFYASLSLALGLAEIVKADAGGRDIDTLFIDEGFGSLDSETLDQVMAVLDELREGGRTVGVVSHVEELKNRIPVQLEVTKSVDGSSLLVTGV